jgi:hypothetical protein
MLANDCARADATAPPVDHSAPFLRHTRQSRPGSTRSLAPLWDAGTRRRIVIGPGLRPARLAVLGDSPSSCPPRPRSRADWYPGPGTAHMTAHCPGRGRL